MITRDNCCVTFSTRLPAWSTPSLSQQSFHLNKNKTESRLHGSLNEGERDAKGLPRQVCLPNAQH